MWPCNIQVCSPSQEDGLNIGTSRHKPQVMEISCWQAHIGEKPKAGEFKTTVSTIKWGNLQGIGRGESSFSRGAAGLTGRKSATPERQAGAAGDQAATRGQGREHRAARPGTQRLLRVPHWVTNDREKGWEQISEIRLTPPRGWLSQEEVEKRVEEKRKDW